MGRSHSVLLIVSLPCEQGPLGCSLVDLVFEYRMRRSHSVLVYLLFNYHVSRGHLVLH